MEAAPDGVIVDRRTLAVQPRGEEDAPAPGSTRAAISFNVAEEIGRRGGVRVERIAREQQVVPQPGEAGARGLVLVRHQVAAGKARGDGGDVGQGVGLLEGHVAADPARRPDVEVPVEVLHRAGSDGGRMEVGGAGDDRSARQEAELGRRGGRHAPEDAAGRHEFGQGAPLEPGQVDEGLVVGHGVDVAVSVTQCKVIESWEARARPVRRKLR